MPRKSPSMSVARVYLDRGGYERGGGRYFGHDREDVYRLSVDGDGYRYFRASSRKDALAKAKKIVEREGARFLGGLGMAKKHISRRHAKGNKRRHITGRRAAVNPEGMTWTEWRRASRGKGDSMQAREAWRRGEDPTEWAADFGFTPRGRRRDEESHVGAYLLLGGCVLVAGVGLYAAVKA